MPGGLEGKVILDPMMGGGTTLHEAIRMGANVIGADLDPIPVLQARATLSEASLNRLEIVFDEVHQAARKKLKRYFTTSAPCCGRSTELQYVLFGQKKKCNCGDVILVDSYILRHESDGSKVRIDPKSGIIYRIQKPEESSAIPGQSDGERDLFVEKSVRSCVICSEPYEEYTELPFYQRFHPIAVVGPCNCETNGGYNLFFKKPDAQDLQKIESANKRRPRYARKQRQFVVQPGPKSNDLLAHGIPTYLDLFSSRQLLYITEMIRLLNPLDGLLKLNLGLLVSTSLEFNSMLCGYKGGNVHRPGAIRHVFSHHAYSFPYTALENNPLSKKKSSGTLISLFNARIRRGKKWAEAPVERLVENGKVIGKKLIHGEQDFGLEVEEQHHLDRRGRKFMLIQGSSVSLPLEPNSVDYVVTDPPYFDNVQYSDLSNFFRVWLMQIFGNDAKWKLNIRQSAVDLHTNSNGQYENVLARIFKECHRVLYKDGGRLIFTFHQWNPKGWAALTIALKKAQFILTNRYVIHAENIASVHIANMEALHHDAVLILSPRLTNNSESTFLLPNKLDRGSSEKFTHDCSSALGWMLNNNVSARQIKKLWKRLLD